jgi:hypothetical protein
MLRCIRLHRETVICNPFTGLADCKRLCICDFFVPFAVETLLFNLLIALRRQSSSKDFSVTCAVVSRQSSPSSACAPSQCARGPSPLYSPSLHLNLTQPHRLPLCALYRLTSAHPSCLECAHPRSHGYRERQLLARRIQGSQNGLYGDRNRPLISG